jgi:hypothetical protein
MKTKIFLYLIIALLTINLRAQERYIGVGAGIFADPDFNTEQGVALVSYHSLSEYIGFVNQIWVEDFSNFDMGAAFAGFRIKFYDLFIGIEPGFFAQDNDFELIGLGSFGANFRWRTLIIDPNIGYAINNKNQPECYFRASLMFPLK